MSEMDSVYSAVLDGEPAEQLSILDPEAARRRLAVFVEQTKTMRELAEGHTVTDAGTLKTAVEMAAQAKKITKAVDQKRKEIIAEPSGFVSNVNTFCKAMTSDLEAVVRDLNGKVNTYQVEQDRIRREAKRKAREEAEAQRRKLEEEQAAERARIEAEAQKAGSTAEEAKAMAEATVDPIIVPEPVLPAPETITRTAEGSAHLRKEWTWEEVDFASVPDAFKALDTKKINQAVKSGTREIPGLRIFQKQTTVFRTN